MRTRHFLTTGLAAFSLFALAACTSPGGGDAPVDGIDTVPGGAASCLDGSWNLDEQALANDLGENIAATGAAVISSEATGGAHMTVSGDTMTWVSDVTYTMAIDLGDGLTLVTNQLQVGESSGHWSVERDQVVFSDWEAGITITNDATINGMPAGTTTTELPTTGEGVPMTVTCEGDSLSTHPEGSPFTSYWNRE
jgi:hypothetical protein